MKQFWVQKLLRSKVLIHEILFIHLNHRVCGFRAILMRESVILGIENCHITNKRKEEEYIIVNFESNKIRLIQEN